MTADLNLFAIAGAKARHAAARQAVISRNVANADTPGYRARDIEPFDAAYARTISAGGAGAKFSELEIDTPGTASPNGNTVSIEDQMLRAGAASRDHDAAVTIYSKAMSMLRAAVGVGR
ncbi:MAG: hypothetical protein KDA46_08095 [Parvularculaceae bacterium]|nr:hypothetical protein [Parvularculaceae bacterium]